MRRFSDLDGRKQVKIAIAVGMLVGLIAVPAIGAYLDNSGVEQSGTVAYKADSGPLVNFTHSNNISLTNWNPDVNTVDLNTEDGNITFQSAGDTSVNLSSSEILATETQLTSIDTSSANLVVDPEGKPLTILAGEVNTFAYRSPTIDDGTVDFRYGGPSSGNTTVQMGGLPSGEDVYAIDADSGETLAADTTNSDGEAVFAAMPNSDHDVLLQSTGDDSKLGSGGPEPSQPATGDPQITIIEPTRQEELVRNTTDIVFNVDDPDFGSGDEVSVDTILNGTTIDSRTINSSQRITIFNSSFDPIDAGAHTISVVAVDSAGNQVQQTWEFYRPNFLFIRNGSAPFNLIDDRTVTVEFTEGNTQITRTTTTGKIPLTGIGTDTIDANISANQYASSSLTIDETWQPQTAYLYRNEGLFTTTLLDIRFTLEDRTGGRYENNNATLVIEEPIDQSGSGQSNYTQVYSSEFGSAGTVATLEKGETYRLIVRNDLGDQRMLGDFTPTQEETVPLVIGEFGGADPTNSDNEYIYNATYVPRDSLQNQVRFEFNDKGNATERLAVQIYERGNRSNVLLRNTTFSGPYGQFSLTETVPSNDENASWVIEVHGVRNGNGFTIREIVGPQRSVLLNLPWWVRAFVAFGSIFVVAGLFSQANGDVGGLAVAGLAGIWWFIGFLPDSVGINLIALALVIAGILFINERRESPGL